MLAAKAENLTVEQVRSGNELLCRAAGAAYLHSAAPERWAKAFDWFRRAGELGAPGLEFRLEGYRERGYKEVRERVVKAQAAARAKRYAEARKLLDEVSGPWSHDGPLRLEIDRALADVLAAELRELAGAKDWGRALKVQRLLRGSHEGHYDAESLHPLFARVLRESGFWAPLSISPSAPHWTWTGKAEGKPAPAAESRAQGHFLRFAAGGELSADPKALRGASGFTVEVQVGEPGRPFRAGFTFDRAPDGSRHRMLVIQDPGEVVLYEVGTKGEVREGFQPLERPVTSSRWVDLSVIADAGDLVCLVDRKPVILRRQAVTLDRGFALTTRSAASFRTLEQRQPK
jgi:hypothetical protein